MDQITTAIELLGALAVIVGLAVVVAPLVGIGWAVVLVGACLIGLSWLITRRSRRRTPGGELG